MVIFQKNTGRCGVSPQEGVADKQQSGEKRHCLQGRFAERLAWERGEVFPLFFLSFCFFRVKTEVYFFDNKSE